MMEQQERDNRRDGESIQQKRSRPFSKTSSSTRSKCQAKHCSVVKNQDGLDLTVVH